MEVVSEVDSTDVICLFHVAAYFGVAAFLALPAPSWTSLRAWRNLVEVGLGWKPPVTIVIMVVYLFAVCNTFVYKDFLKLRGVVFF